MPKGVSLKAVVSIVDYRYADKVSQLYLKNNVPLNLITHGHGSATSDILDYLGIGETKKGVIVSLATSKAAKSILNKLASEMNFDKPGTGIAFTVPLSSASNFLSSICVKSEIKNKEVDNYMYGCEYELIMTIVTKGNFNDVMDAAKSAGATGGTLIHARGLGTEEAAKFLGITIQPEKDLVMIIVPKKNKQNIMEAIVKKAGLSTDGKGISFSLPVDSAIGLRNLE